MSYSPTLAIRWTIGDVHPRGFEALQLSLWGAWRLFGDTARYTVCVNTVPLQEARRAAGAIPDAVVWRATSRQDIPAFLGSRLGSGLAEGVAWKFAPLRLYSECYELSLDNDCILWRMPKSLQAWLAMDDGQTCLLAEDVHACFGQFEAFCPLEPRNAGIRGLPPGFDYAAALEATLNAHAVPLISETDEQGLQVAALSRHHRPLAVSLQDVSICSPFAPHLPHLGRCGAHFVGLNARDIPWDYYGRPAAECLTEHWALHRPDLYRAVGLSVPQDRDEVPPQPPHPWSGLAAGSTDRGPSTA